MNNAYQQTIKTIFLGFIYTFIIIVFIGCNDDGLFIDNENENPKTTNNNKNNGTSNNTNNKTNNDTNNKTPTYCLPGQAC